MKRMICLFLLLMLLATGAAAQSNLMVFGDEFANGWQNWSWSTTLDPTASNPVYAGSRSLAATYTSAWAGVYLRSSAALPAGYTTLRFQIHGGQSGGQRLRVDFYNEASQGTTAATITVEAGRWQQVDVPLGSFGPSERLWGIVWQDTTGGSQPTFYLDAIQLLPGVAPTPAPPGSGPALRIDAGADRRAINPYIYGMNFASAEMAAELRLPLNRWGGNSTTRYNWQIDVSNRAADWFFENIPNDVADVSRLPLGSSADVFVRDNEAANTESAITLPLIGWTPKDRVYATCGFSVALYGAQQSTDPYKADCGNGVRPNGSLITGNNPRDTSLPIDERWVQDWVRHLSSQFGTASAGGVRYYFMDNEPSLWHHTHRDVRPQPLGSLELRDLTIRYGAAVKAVDPAAQLFGPAEWGWTGYFMSGVDQASQQWSNPPEASLRGGLPLIPWYLDQLRRYEQTSGSRLLDFLDLHYYPQGAGVALGGAGDAATQALRLRSTRSLWDPTYTDESWIGEPVRLIPRMREWVDQYYPGTQLAIMEYNWGAFEHINGALAQADVLGIFGREGLDAAAIWVAPEPQQPVAYAFRMYRNYDGAGGAFGETSVRAVSTDSAQLATFAALRGDGALTVMVINKTGQPLTSPVSITNFSAGAAQVYRYSNADWSRIVREADLPAGTSNITFPAQSITLLVYAPASPTTPTPLPTSTPLPTLTPTPGLIGDINGDGAVTLVDFALLAASFNKRPTDTGYDARADLNSDQVVTLADFALLAANFNRTRS